MAKKKLLTGLGALLGAFASAFALFRFMGMALPYGVLLFLPALLGCWLVWDRSLRIDWRGKGEILPGLYAGLLALSFVVGRKIHLWSEPFFEAVRAADLIYWLIFTGFFFLAVRWGLEAVSRTVHPWEARPRRRMVFWLVFAGILLCWLPTFLVYYPGKLASDSLSSIRQAMGIMPLKNHHPVVFTLLVKLCMQPGLWLGNANLAVATFTAVQMVGFALMLSAGVYWLYRRGAPLWGWLGAALFFGLNPVIAGYAVTMWKDTLFGGFCLLTILVLADAVESRGAIFLRAGGLFRLAFGVLGMAFFRNNGKFILVLVLPVLVLVFRAYWKRLSPLCAALLIGIFAMQGPGYRALGVEAGSFTEAVGVPLQQVAYTLREKGEVSAEQRAFLDRLMPTEKMASLYTPGTVDSIKFNEAYNWDELDANKSEFLKVWLSMLPKNFKLYTKAWLMETLGYFHVGTTGSVVFNDISNPEQVAELGITTDDRVAALTGLDLKPVIYRGTTALMKLPVLDNLFSLGAIFWFLIFCCLSWLRGKEWRRILAVLPLIGCWGTLMIAAPTYCEFRYLFALHLALPLLAAGLLRGAKR